MQIVGIDFTRVIGLRQNPRDGTRNHLRIVIDPQIRVVQVAQRRECARIDCGTDRANYA